jgi:hypothetical protein
LVELETGVALDVASTATLEIAPLSVDAVKEGEMSLRHSVDRTKPQCEVARSAVTEGVRNHVLAANVFHGAIRIETSVTVTSGVELNVDSAIPIRIGGPIDVEAGSLKLYYLRGTHTLAGIGQAKTQGFSPAYLNKERVAKIVYHLQGDRGADLEINVKQARRAEDLGLFKNIVLRIKQLLNEVEFDYGALFVGDPLVVASEIEDASYDKLAVAIAAEEIRQYGRSTIVATKFLSE